MIAFPVKLKLSDLGFYLPVRTGPRFSNFQFSSRFSFPTSVRLWSLEASRGQLRSSSVYNFLSWCRRDREVWSRGPQDVDVLAVLDLWSLRSHPRSCPGHPGFRLWPSLVVSKTLNRAVTRNSEIQDSMDIDVLNWPGPKSVKAFLSQSKIRYEVFRSLKNYWEPYLFERMWK